MVLPSPGLPCTMVTFPKGIYGSHIPAHINPVLVFLRDSVVDEQRQIENGADRRKARFVCHPAVAGRNLHIRVGVAAPCGGDVCQRSFQGFVPPFLHILIELRRISPTPPPLPVGRGTAQRNIYPRRLPPESISGRNPSRVLWHRLRRLWPLTDFPGYEDADSASDPDEQENEE